jgi:hypothetical protein
MSAHAGHCRYWVLSIVIVAALFSHKPALGQGSLEPPGPPAPTMHSLDEIFAGITNLDWNVTEVTNALNRVDWATVEAMAGDMAAITNRIGDFNWNDMLRLVNRFELLNTNVGGLVGVISNVDWSVFTRMAADMASFTQRIGIINWDDVMRLNVNVTNLLGFMSRVNWQSIEAMANDMGSVTNLLGRMNWDDVVILNTNVAGLNRTLSNINWSSVEAMCADMISITQRIGECHGAITRIDQNSAMLTNILSVVNWSAISGISSNVATVQARLEAMDGRTAWATNELVRQRVELDQIRALVEENYRILRSMSNVAN